MTTQPTAPTKAQREIAKQIVEFVMYWDLMHKRDEAIDRIAALIVAAHPAPDALAEQVVKAAKPFASIFNLNELINGGVKAEYAEQVDALRDAIAAYRAAKQPAPARRGS